MEQRVDIKRHRLTDLAPCATVGVFGTRRSGKSSFAKYHAIKLHKSGIGRFIVFCGNKDSKTEWSRIIPPMYIHGKDMHKLQEVYEYNEMLVEHDRHRFEREEQEQMHYDPDYEEREYVVPVELRLAIYIDDIGSDRKFMHSSIMRDICSNGRHHGVELIVICQYITQFHPENRDNLDYVAMLKVSNAKSIDRIYNEYVTNTCCAARLFHYLLAACTAKKGKCMFIANSNSMLLSERIFHVQIPYPLPRYPIGKLPYVSYADHHYVSKHPRLDHFDYKDLSGNKFHVKLKT
jgi:hypothetical protein